MSNMFHVGQSRILKSTFVPTEINYCKDWFCIMLSCSKIDRYFYDFHSYKPVSPEVKQAKITTVFVCITLSDNMNVSGGISSHFFHFVSESVHILDAPYSESCNCSLLQAPFDPCHSTAQMVYVIWHLDGWNFMQGTTKYFWSSFKRISLWVHTKCDPNTGVLINGQFYDQMCLKNA